MAPPLAPSTVASSSSRPAPTPTPQPKPVLRVHLNDLSRPGTHRFISSIDLSTILETSVSTVLQNLYSPHSSSIPPTRSVTLILRPMSGVAYTTGLQIDDSHKEIHFNTSYIEQVDTERLTAELTGVVVHEMVHCWQWNALGTAPGGLIEGIADWVRLQADLAPPHWKKEVGGDWAAGYQHTAYFLEYLESRFGKGTVMAVNEGLRSGKYEEKVFWDTVVGKEVKELWSDYQKELKKQLGLTEKETEPKAERSSSGESEDSAKIY